MDYNNRSNETLLDFSGIIWGFLEQWKAVLIFSLIISLLVTGLKYRHDIAEYNAAVTAAKENAITADQAEQRIQEILDSLSDEDRSVVNFALGFHSLISDKCKYQSESPIMSVDPNHTEVLSIIYRISGDIEPSLRSSLDDGYITAFNDYAALESVSEATSTKIAPDYIKELISFSDPYSELSKTPVSIIQDDNTFSVFVIIPEGESSDIIEGAITDIIKKKSRDLSVSIAPHTIEVVSTSSSKAVCNSVLAKQSDIYYSVSYLKSYLSTAVSEFNPQQSAAYNAVLQLQSHIISNEDNIADSGLTPEPAKPEISRRVMAFGVILGILLYLFAFIMYLVFSEKIISANVAKKIIHKRLLGEYYQNNAEAGLLGKLLHSPAVSGFRYRDKNNLEEQAAAVSKALEVISSREDIDNILIVNTCSEQESFTDSIRKSCISDDISLSVLQQADFNDASIKNVNNAVISISYDTRIKQLYSLLDLLDYYRINILGFIYIADF